MDKLHQYIREIINASRNGKLVFFVGAGLSTLSDYPQWWQLVDRYHIGLYGKKKDGNYSSDEYLRIPQIYHDVKGEDEFDKILEDVFAVERSTNQIHDKILALNPVHIITTNYDDLIDKTCWRRGRYFSVISAEEDVANATSSRYLIKVHGDFRRGYRGKHIVLKESDYINYEQDYPLISNLMKTIMATHTIVFIGYGLGDYNINLLLNWVKKLQKDGYNRPFFIRTDPVPIEENTVIYYEKKGLRIIDSASLVEGDGKEYMKRYSTVMDLLIESKDNALLSTNDEIVEFIHQKLSPLFVLQCVRKLDIKYVFDFDYHFEVNGTVIRNKNKGFEYMEHFFNFKKNGIESLSNESRSKFEAISDFFDRNGIKCMVGDEDYSSLNALLEIISPAYHNDFEEMEKQVLVPSGSLEDDYRRTFYLACLGRWEEAYNFYSELLLKSIDESNWWIHYLSQINRYRLYQSISQTAIQLRGLGMLAFGKQYTPFSDEFLSRIEREMKNFDINDVYSGMPYDFQKSYQILEFLSDNEFLYDDTVKLFKLTNKVRSEMSKGSYSFGSLTADFEVQCRLNDNVRFLYENDIWAVFFQEFKQYMRNSLILQFEKAEYEQTRDIDEFGLAMGGGRSGFYIDYYDFINLTKSFSVEDVQFIERSCKIERIEFRDLDRIEIFLIRIADEIIKNFSKDGMNIIFYNQLMPEAKVAFYLTRYVKLSARGLTKIFKALLFFFPERDLDIGKRYLWTERLVRGNGLPKESIPIIEEFLINQAEKHKNSEFSEESTNGLNSSNFGNLIRHFSNEYVSNGLSKYALALAEDMKNQIDFMYRLSPILSSDARNHLMGLKKIEDIDGLLDGLRNGAVESISGYQELIKGYLDNRKTNILTDKRNGITSFYGDNHFVEFGILFFLGELNEINMKNYMGVDDEYDMFIDPASFDFKKFRPLWLKMYKDELLGKIAQNELIRPHVIEVLKERINNSKDKRYLEIFMKHFVK